MKDFVRDEVIASQLVQAGSSGASLDADDTRLARSFRQALLPEGYDNGYRRWGKRTLDLVLVTLSLPVTLPLIGLCALALWVESGFPFFSQDRLGRNGRVFSILKLRTMVRNADKQLETLLATDPGLRAEWEETQKLREDPRITPVGRFLRATSLDELPQVLNVLSGEMSLVGPRPMLPEQLEIYGDTRAYFALRPGLTGVWQVTARGERSFDMRAPMDVDYNIYHTLGGDLKILWRTMAVVLKRDGC